MKHSGLILQKKWPTTVCTKTKGSAKTQCEVVGKKVNHRGSWRFMCCLGWLLLKKWDILRNLWVAWSQDVSQKLRSRLLYTDNISHLPDMAKDVDRLQ